MDLLASVLLPLEDHIVQVRRRLGQVVCQGQEIFPILDVLRNDLILKLKSC